MPGRGGPPIMGGGPAIGAPAGRAGGAAYMPVAAGTQREQLGNAMHRCRHISSARAAAQQQLNPLLRCTPRDASLTRGPRTWRTAAYGPSIRWTTCVVM